MAVFTIKSRKLEKEFCFFMPDGGGYVRLEEGDNHGTLGSQICHGGGFRGQTIECVDDADFHASCRKWYRQHMKNFEMA